MKRLMEGTQKLGRALMLPIAVLPIAGLLLRLGQPDLLDLAPVAAAGEAIFGSLGCSSRSASRSVSRARITARRGWRAPWRTWWRRRAPRS
jgi:hypothetical protein